VTLGIGRTVRSCLGPCTCLSDAGCATSPPSSRDGSNCSPGRSWSP
jgi:hypothetical protein